MKIKICGFREKNNLNAIEVLKPDFIGFIFYDLSKRFVGFENEVLSFQSNEINKVAVFVNQPIELVLQIASKFHFKYIQLHGNESPNYCKTLKEKGFIIIKAFGVDQHFLFSAIEKYDQLVDYYLFDTKTASFGGSGKVFEWKILEQYPSKKPFFLSGGIGLDNLEDILAFKNDFLFGIDVNSKMEVNPGVKNIEKCKQLIETIRTATNKM